MISLMSKWEALLSSRCETVTSGVVHSRISLTPGSRMSAGGWRDILGSCNGSAPRNGTGPGPSWIRPPSAKSLPREWDAWLREFAQVYLRRYPERTERAVHLALDYLGRLADFCRARSTVFALVVVPAFSNSRMILKQVWVGKGTEVGSELLSRGFRCGDGEGGGGLRGRGKLCRVVL